MQERQIYGKDAEKRAELWFLQNTQSRLLFRNFRCKWGEIDLIFEESHRQNLVIELVFVEVRACSFRNWLEGSETVGWKKQQCLKKTAQFFLSSYQGKSTLVRFDLLSWDGTDWKHLPNLWIDSE